MLSPRLHLCRNQDVAEQCHPHLRVPDVSEWPQGIAAALVLAQTVHMTHCVAGA